MNQTDDCIEFNGQVEDEASVPDCFFKFLQVYKKLCFWVGEDE